MKQCSKKAYSENRLPTMIQNKKTNVTVKLTLALSKCGSEIVIKKSDSV